MAYKDSYIIGGRLYTVVAAGIFLFAAILHALRAYYEWDLIINGWYAPIWLSWLIALVTFLMSITAIRRMH